MIQVVNRAIDIIEYVAKDGERPKLLGEMATALKLNAATCANIVKTLVVRGYLQKVHGKGYLLGPQVYSISEGAANYQDIVDASDKEMESIKKKINESTLLAVLRADKRVIIYKKNADQMIQAQTPDVKNAWDSSTGRMLVAFMDDDAIEKYIAEHGLPSGTVWKEASTKRKLLEQVQVIRTQGYSLIEDTSQITGIAAPVYRKGKFVASFSIYMPSFRYTHQLRRQMIQLCLSASKNISRKLS